jgi:hypothetical protein
MKTRVHSGFSNADVLELLKGFVFSLDPTEIELGLRQKVDSM